MRWRSSPSRRRFRSLPGRPHRHVKLATSACAARRSAATIAAPRRPGRAAWRPPQARRKAPPRRPAKGARSRETANPPLALRAPTGAPHRPGETPFSPRKLRSYSHLWQQEQKARRGSPARLGLGYDGPVPTQRGSTCPRATSLSTKIEPAVRTSPTLTRWSTATCRDSPSSRSSRRSSSTPPVTRICNADRWRSASTSLSAKVCS